MLEKSFHQAAATVTDAESGKLFGKLCYKINGKAFCCFFEDAMVFKLPGETHTKALNQKGAKLFDPSGKGRPKKEWVQLPFTSLKKWEKFAQSAAEYVAGK